MTTKDATLDILIKNKNRTLSGNEIAKQLGISRNAVWKSINQLKCDGYGIDSTSNKGYLLYDVPVCSEIIESGLNTNIIGKSIAVFKTINSTNTYAKSLKSAENGTVIIALEQTDGKGRKGRSFYSPKASGIYFSVIWKPQLNSFKPGLITSCTAVAVAKAIDKLCGICCGIKWVNDIFLNGKKICGILTEGTFELETSAIDSIIIGIGINVGKAEFPSEIKGIASSIENECGRRIPKNLLISEVLNQLEIELNNMDSLEFFKESKRRSIILGKKVTVISGNEKYNAIARDIDNDGKLVVEKDGVIISLVSGEVSIKY